jgi:hypothetical protein
MKLFDITHGQLIKINDRVYRLVSKGEINEAYTVILSDVGNREKVEHTEDVDVELVSKGGISSLYSTGAFRHLEEDDDAL